MCCTKDESLNVIQEYFEKNHPLSGKAFTRNSFISEIMTPHRTYYHKCSIDGEIVSSEVTLGITVPSYYRMATAEYISKINAHLKGVNIRIDINSTIYAYCSHNISDKPITANIIEDMETSCVCVLEIYGDTIDKLAHGILLKEDEITPEKVEENHLDDIKMDFGELISEEFEQFERTLKDIGIYDEISNKHNDTFMRRLSQLNHNKSEDINDDDCSGIEDDSESPLDDFKMSLEEDIIDTFAEDE